jgi:DNA uptake protein ComE-like DNA-binding protein
MKKWNRTVTALILAVLFASVAAAAAGQEGVVNINTASAEQLTFLPRVGPALAGRIVEFRDSNGKFKATDELILARHRRGHLRAAEALRDDRWQDHAH